MNRELLKPKKIIKGIKYLFKNGIGLFVVKIKHVFWGLDYYYPKWFEKYKSDAEELERQKRERFAYAPVISVIVPTYNTPEKYLREMIESVMTRSNENWQLCIADGSDTEKEAGRITRDVIKEYKSRDSRITCIFLDENKGISENTNAALALAKGEYVGLFDHDDLLEPDALYHVVKALNENVEDVLSDKTNDASYKGAYDIIYTDEDMINSKGNKRMTPKFKPDFSMDLILVHNYITHFFVAKKELIHKVGAFDRKYDGAQDYDLILKCIEQTKRIKHIPHILYHWRIHKNSTAGNPKSKEYAYDAGRRALKAHLDRVGIKAEVGFTDMTGLYDVRYMIDKEPLLSIVIPNKDHIDDLTKCVSSIYDKSTYKTFEFVIVENGSTEKETFQYYEAMEQKHDNFHVVKWEKGFNYSAINNFGVSKAKGEYILLLNNDTELISPDALSRMLGICMRGDVGAVGAKLFFADDTVQHAGIVIGFAGYAGHVFSGCKDTDMGYMMRARINSNFSAVTAACLMTPKAVFNKVGGLCEEFVVAGNDVDYCLRVARAGFLVTYCANAKWYHYESKSRGYEDTPEKKARFEKEISLFRERWQDILRDGDPFYNINFPVSLPPFTLSE